MPTYCYKCQCGKGFEEYRTLRNRSAAARCSCGRVAVRDFQSENSYSPKDTSYRNMLWSDACGVSSGGLADAKRKNPDHHFRKTEEGTYQRGFKSARHRKECLKSLGMVDRDSFY